MSPQILTRKMAQHVVDLAILSLAFLAAQLLRFEGIPSGMSLKIFLFQWPYVVLLGYVSYLATGVYRYVWRYVAIRELKGFLLAHGLVMCVLLIARLGLPARFPYARVPLSIIFLNCILAWSGSVGIRVLHRVITEGRDRRLNAGRAGGRATRRVLLVGAGYAGNLVAKELHGRGDLGMTPVGFVDDDPLKRGQMIQGLTVLGSIEEIPKVAVKNNVDLLLISVASITGAQLRRIKIICDGTGIDTKIIPGLYELIGGTVNFSRIRNVGIEDLLGREAVYLDESSISSFLRGKVVLVTGAGGSIGSEMCRQICNFSPAKILLLEQAENALFEIHRELYAGKFNFEIVPIIADICDAGRVASVFSTYTPQVVIHAAAHKHVPMMEWNPGEAIKNNIFGTKILADASLAAGVERFIMISTDKAVNPSSIMGTTKRVAEMYLQSLNLGAIPSKVADGAGGKPRTMFIAVRFGNVLGSAGSVIPIFKEQIKNGGPVTVTHPEMTRYFMTIPEASQLVLQAAVMGIGGEVFVLDMGAPVKIVDLARDLIRLSGLDEGAVEIVFTGPRPGEKLFEEICLTSENFDRTQHPKIFKGNLKYVERSMMESNLERLRLFVDGHSNDEISGVLREIVPEFRSTVNTGERLGCDR